MNQLQRGKRRHRFQFRIGSRIILILAGLLIFSSSASASDSFRLDHTALEPISGIVDQAVKDGKIPGAVILIGHGDQVVFRKAFGWRTLYPAMAPMTENVIFDTASLTKVIATTSAVMHLVERKKLSLDAPAARYWPEFRKYRKGGITLRHLLTHYSGLRVEPKLGPHINGLTAVLKTVASEKPLHPPGLSYQYSDLNFIILGEIVRRVSGLPLDRYCSLHIFEPLRMKDTAFRPAASSLDRIAPTVYRDGQLLCGEVHDPVCHRMGGIAGHAGLFSTADDLAVFARMMLGGGRAGKITILRPETVEMMTIPQSPPGKARFRGLGWDMEPPSAGSAGGLFPAYGYSHLGYTGTGIWIDPLTGTYLILLTNRVHSNGGGSVKELRQSVRKHLAEAVRSTFLSREGAAPAAAACNVDTGIDVLERENYASLTGLRVGLITNHTGRNASGIRTIDLLHRAPGVKLAAIFSPEHGIDGIADAAVPSTQDGITGLPIYSLYGGNRRPAKETLEGLDALVFDIQDAGARFYTYISTMGYAMESAAERGIPFFVLDRPNPITADDVQGPISDRGTRSFTSYFPLPIRHGMTVGELARMFNAGHTIGADLRVIRMRGYSRKMWFDETGLTWINPSPNLRSLTEATLYPGVALLEGANVSVGRGTETPFELVGAPWVRSSDLFGYLEHRRIPGIHFSIAEFTPESGIFQGRMCHGVRLMLLDREILNPTRMGIEIIAALHRLYPKSFHLDKTLGMIGSRQVLKSIRAGHDPRVIEASWQDSLETFRKFRADYLLY